MLHICQNFKLNSTAISCEPYGSGHINQTYLINCTGKEAYILQKINNHVFKDVPNLMKNISSVCSYLSSLNSDPRQVLTLVPTLDNKTYYESENAFYRMYIFVENSLCLQRAETLEDFRQSGYAFGNFQKLLSNFDASQLSETIPDFHNTKKRFSALQEAVRKNIANRAESAKEEISFALKYEKECGIMVDMLERGELPLRVTHNDTKLNNVLLDNETREALCVIDLDTVMPGLAANDFGDSIRFGAATAAEDEKDLSKLDFSLALYKAYAEGFLKGCGGILSAKEIETLPYGAKLMTYECGIRFLTDYLSGDTYFKTHYPEHNLVRCRTQFKLVRCMEENWSEMNKIIQEAKQ